MKLCVLSMLSVAVLGALLLGATAAQHIQDKRVLSAAELQIDADASALKALSVQLQDARHALDARPVVEKLVTLPCPSVVDVGHQTPVFGRESQTYAGHR